MERGVFLLSVLVRSVSHEIYLPVSDVFLFGLQLYDKTKAWTLSCVENTKSTNQPNL